MARPFAARKPLVTSVSRVLASAEMTLARSCMAHLRGPLTE